MFPALEGGDYIVIFRPGALRPGRIYVIDHLDLGRIVKRLSAVKDGRAYFAGDNSASTPQPIIAPVMPERIYGRVIMRISKTGLNWI